MYMCMLPICMYVSERVGIGPLRDRVPLCICVCYLYVCELEREREREGEREGERIAMMTKRPSGKCDAELDSEHRRELWMRSSSRDSVESRKRHLLLP